LELDIARDFAPQDLIVRFSGKRRRKAGTALHYFLLIIRKVPEPENDQKLWLEFSLTCPKSKSSELDELMKETNIVTRKDLFNNALTLFQWAVKSKRAGRIVASLDEETGTAKEIVMPALESVRSTSLTGKS